jgi:phage baseplate assembly protein W
MANKGINVRFPFQNSPKGFYVDLTETTTDAVRSDLMHLILTNKGERYYKPDFGTNLRKFIFEPNDTLSHSTISQDIKDTVKKYLPNLQINSVDVKKSEDSSFAATVTIAFTITEGALEVSDLLIINL